MQKIKSIGISYWFKKLDINPCEKVEELKNELQSFFHEDFLYNKNGIESGFSIPRIQTLSSDKKYFFTMSLINANLIIDVNNEENFDQVILEINNNIKLFYDILKEVYNLHIIYTSIKMEIIDDMEDTISFLMKKFNISKDNYESLSLKKGIIKDDYYINYSFDACKEYNFNVPNAKLNSQDLFDSTMLISLSEAKKKREYLLIVLEINDRYIYNINSNHETNKETLRGMILELKNILNSDLYK